VPHVLELCAVHALVLEGVHCTQVFVVVLQAGVEPEHAVELEALHCTQNPVARLQAGVEGVPEHWASDVQPATQVSVI
jgi:hypothetical protein